MGLILHRPHSEGCLAAQGLRSQRGRSRGCKVAKAEQGGARNCPANLRRSASKLTQWMLCCALVTAKNWHLRKLVRIGHCPSDGCSVMHPTLHPMLVRAGRGVGQP